MTQFLEPDPKLDSLWRAIILFGRNVASYKFALAKSLIDIVNEGNKSFVTLEELAIPFSTNIAEHLKLADRQSTSSSSKYLDTCREFNNGDITKEELDQITVRLGFVNVIDAFHFVNQDNIPIRFFEDERKTKDGITITDSLFRLLDKQQAKNLPNEVEARWRLVETAWSMNMSARLLQVKAAPEEDLLFVENNLYERINVTSCIDGLIGYQKGKCFYCGNDIYIKKDKMFAGEVDHYFPHVLKSISRSFTQINIDGVWNLVLSCVECNRGENGKFARIPKMRFLNLLNMRNNYLINSHHPLRETLISQTGKTDIERSAFLMEIDKLSINYLIHRWEPNHES